VGYGRATGSSILIVHSEKQVRASVRTILEHAGHRVRETKELAQINGAEPDLMLISWTALSPVAESLLRLRSHDTARQSRIIVLAPRHDLRAAISALELGADDCLAVPFEGEELLVRVNACLRRAPATLETDRLVAGPVVLDRGVHRLLVKENPIELAPTEFRLMAFFLENQGRVFSRNELLMRAWAKNIQAGPRTVDVHVRRLRQQLEPFVCDNMIQTVRGFGYRFSADTGAH
jgi:two-component system phosphate regulon response regulator PhoB